MRDNKTVLGLNKLDKTIIILVPIVLGGLIGWFIPVIANWLLKLPAVPWEKLIKLIASSNSIWVSVIAMIIGIIVGIFLTLVIFAESLEVTITDEKLQVKLDDKVKIFDKKEISAIYVENKQLIILGKTSNELYREHMDTKIDKVREAFNDYSYPWKEKDPFEHEYQRWVPGHPDFPERVNALLNAREHALKEDEKKEAKQLREDLAQLGVVIQDKNNAQYARLVQDK